MRWLDQLADNVDELGQAGDPVHGGRSGQTTVIELGELAPGAAPEPETARPLIRRRRDIRRYGLAAVAVLCVLTVTGSARPEPRSLATLWSMPYRTDQWTLTDDALYLLEPSARSRVTRYDAASGRLQWSTHLPDFAGWMSTDAAGLLLVPTVKRVENVVDDAGNAYQLEAVQDTVALDVATGTVRWRQRGEVALADDQTVLLTRWDYQAARLTEMRLIRSSDGTVLWTLAPDPPISSWTTVAADRLVTVTADGELQVRRFADGGLVTTGRVPWVPDPKRDDDLAYLMGAHATLYVLRAGSGQQEVTAYDPDTLAKLWNRRFRAGYGMFDCGRVICVGEEAGGVGGRDPRTGRLLWQGEGWDYARPLGDGRLLTEGREGGRAALVDEATGRLITDLGAGAIVLDAERGQILMIGPVREPPWGLKVSQLDRTGELILRGSIGPVVNHGCQLSGGRLACGPADGRLTVRDVG